MNGRKNAPNPVDGFGAMAEISVIFFRAVVGAGGTRFEALMIAAAYLIATTTTARIERKEKEHGEADV